MKTSELKKELKIGQIIKVQILSHEYTSGSNLIIDFLGEIIKINPNYLVCLCPIGTLYSCQAHKPSSFNLPRSKAYQHNIVAVNLSEVVEIISDHKW